MGVRGDYALFQYFLKLMVKKKRNCESRDLFNHLFSQPPDHFTDRNTLQIPWDEAASKQQKLLFYCGQ